MLGIEHLRAWVNVEAVGNWSISVFGGGLVMSLIEIHDWGLVAFQELKAAHT